MKLSDVSAPDWTEATIHRIAKGNLDDHLSHIIDMAITRKRTVAQVKARDLANRIHKGDEVKVSASIKPRYLANVVGTVVERQGSKVVVEFPVPMGRFGRRIRIPLTALELLKINRQEVMDVEIDA